MALFLPASFTRIVDDALTGSASFARIANDA